MAKVSLTDLANLQNDTTATTAINANNAAIETAMTNTLSRDGTSPNQMSAALDMNSNRVLNLPSPVGMTEPLRLEDLTDFQSGSVNFTISGYPTINVLDYGAVADGNTLGTDNTSAFMNAMAAAASTRTEVFVPAGLSYYRFASGITVPDFVILRGEGMIPNPVYQGGVYLQFDESVPICVTLGGNSDNNGTQGLRNLTVTRTGTPPAGSVGVLVKQGSMVCVDEVFSWNHDKCFEVTSVSTAGIGCYLNRIFTGACTDAHIEINDWPECTVTNSRFGTVSLLDQTCDAYIRITGGSHGGGAGPNTIQFDNCLFSQGAGTAFSADSWISFEDIDNTHGNPVVTYRFHNCHAEECNYAIKGDGTGPIVDFYLSDCSFYLNDNKNFTNFVGTEQLTDWHLTNVTLYNEHSGSSIWALTQSKQYDRIFMTGCIFPGEVFISGAGCGGSVISISNSSFFNGLATTGTFGVLHIAGCSGVVDVLNTSGTVISESFDSGVPFKTMKGIAPFIQLYNSAASTNQHWWDVINTGALEFRKVDDAYSTATDVLILGQDGRVRVTPGPILFDSTSNASPSTGDIWFDGTNLKLRQAGTTRTVALV